MPKQIYPFEILEKLPNGLYAAKDDATQAKVALYETTTDDSLKIGTKDALTEIAKSSWL